MVHDNGVTPNRERRGLGLYGRLLVAVLLVSGAGLATGAAGWHALASIRHEVGSLPSGVAVDAIVRSIDNAGLLIASGGLVAVVVLACVILYLARSVVFPVRRCAGLLDRLGRGDDGGEVPAHLLDKGDEIGDLARAVRSVAAYQRERTAVANQASVGDFSGVAAMRDPSDALGLAVRRIAGTAVDAMRRANAHAGEVLTVCDDIKTSGSQLTGDSADFAAAATEISAGIDKIGAHAGSNVDMAKKAGALASNGIQSVERGYEDIGEMGVVMMNMQACGDKIVSIAKSIGDIAFQTNLLALNASVEAARAGRHGKGFTIVAEEVRRLAVRTRKAAEETSTLMQETVAQVELASGIAGRINGIFADMQTFIQEADVLMDKISSASNEQSGGIEHVATILHRMERSAQENMARIGDVMEKVDTLAGRAGALHRAMGRFAGEAGRLPDAGSAGTSPALGYAADGK